MKLIDQLEEIKEEIAREEKTVAKAEVKMEEIAKTLKKDFGISIDGADDYLAKLKKKSKKLKTKVVELVEDANEKYELDLDLEE